MKRTRHLILKVILTFAAAYGAVVGVMAIAQTHMLFPAALSGFQAPRLPDDAVRLTLKADSGERLVGVRFAPRSGGSAAGVLVVGFGGNGSNADGTALMLRRLYPGAHVAAFHYRGYAPSEGDPSTAGLRRDALVIHDHLVKTVKPRAVVAVGISIGSGIAAYLSRQRDLGGLILVTPFDSLTAVAEDHYPWAPVNLLLRHRLPTAQYLDGRPTPTALIAAGADRVVPPARTRALKPAIRNLVFERTLAGANHNDIYGRRDFYAAMGAAFEAVTRRR